MIRYPALITGNQGAFGISFPDLPGLFANGKTVDEALRNAEEVLRDHVFQTEKDGAGIALPSTLQSITVDEGSTLIAVPLLRRPLSGICSSLSLDQAVVAFIDAEAGRRGMTRAAFIEWMKRRLPDTI